MGEAGPVGAERRTGEAAAVKDERTGDERTGDGDLYDQQRLFTAERLQSRLLWKHRSETAMKPEQKIYHLPILQLPYNNNKMNAVLAACLLFLSLAILQVPTGTAICSDSKDCAAGCKCPCKEKNCPPGEICQPDGICGPIIQ